MKKNKFNYLLVIQQNYAGYWEDVSEYEATSTGDCKERTNKTFVSKNTGLLINRSISLCSLDADEYRLMGYPTRVIFRKELNAITAI